MRSYFFLTLFKILMVSSATTCTIISIGVPGKEPRGSAGTVFLTMHADVAYAIRAFEVGASGYVLKHSSSSELRIAIHAAIKGQTYVSPMIAGELVQVYRGETYQQVKEAQPLTMRQSEIIQLLVEGCSAKEIANIVNVSSRTVEFHKHNLMLKLRLKTKSGLIKYAIKNGFTAVEGLKDAISS